MGGCGSGNYLRSTSKSTTESQHRIDIRWMKQQGCLRPGNTGILSWSSRGKKTGSISYRLEANYMVLNYRQRSRNGEWGAVEQFIRFEWTPCNFGGQRTWFLCPQCGKRVAILYDAGKYFWCRHCLDLTYACQQESRVFRMISKAQKIRERLGGKASLSHSFPGKPKNMHWKTYRRLRGESKQAEAVTWALINQSIENEGLWV